MSMQEKQRGAVIVQDDAGALAGIFSERDLMFRVDHSNDQWLSIPVQEVMTPRPVCVANTDSIAKALKR